MKEEDQRIAIAEACGWTNDGRLWWSPMNEKGASHGTGMRVRIGNSHEPRTPFPDYLNNLAAMHEAEKVLMQRLDLWWDYQNNLKKTAKDLDRFGVGSEIHATAAQRAEAFLKTIGKWEEGE